MNILLLGGGGQVGWELQRALAPLGALQVFGAHSPGPDAAPHLRADFTQPEQVLEIVRIVQPDVIVNAAAHTAVDKAESEPELARLVNATTPGLIAQEAARLGALLVHYSTDYVFDGSGQAPRDEDAATAPLSVYGQTKREGELAIAVSGCRHLTFRTSWVYAARGGNFARTMLRLAAERDAAPVFDLISAPSRYTVDRFQRLPNIRLHPHGIEIEAFARTLADLPDTDELVFLPVGGTTPTSGAPETNPGLHPPHDQPAS